MGKSYWIGSGNLQLEYGYEPSEELMEEMDGDVFELNEESIRYRVSETLGESF